MNNDFLQRTSTLFGLPESAVLERFSLNRPLSIRVNTLKSDKEKIQAVLQKNNMHFSPVSWWSNAFIIDKVSSRELTELPEYQNGDFYIQNLSSMLPPLVLAPEQDEKILDMTAAPGSKTTQIAALMNNTGEIVANDISRNRAYKLKANLDKCGVTNATITHYPAEIIWKRFMEYFDRTLLDAPCSMEGTFQTQDPSTYDNWSLKHVKRLAQQQKWMLRSAVSATKAGGLIVYSTCTLSPEENEEIIDWILDKEQGRLIVEDITLKKTFFNGITSWKNKKLSPELGRTLRVIPDELMEGFFVAKLRKTGSNVRQVRHA